MRKKLSIMLAGLVGAGALFTGCSSHSDVTVSVQSVAMITGYSSLGQFDRFAGIVESGESINIEKNENLEIKDIFVKVGDTINPGDVLFSYNTETISLDLEKMQLELEQLKNQVNTKKDQIKELENEKKKANSEDQLGYTLQIQNLQLDVKETEYTITAKEKEIARTSSILSDSSVVSEVSGTVANVNTEDATDDWGNLKPFITINQSGDFRVKGTVNEQNIRALTEQTPVLIRSRVSDETWSGVISKVDMEHPISGGSDMYFGVNDEMTTSSNYPFYVQLEEDENLMLGQHVFIEPNLGQTEQEGLPLPATFLVIEGEEAYVWAAGDKDRLEKRTVMLGEYDQALDSYQIIDGLKVTDYIAIPSDECADGVDVTYYDEDSFQNENGQMPEEGVVDGDYEDGAYEDGAYEDGAYEDGAYEDGAYEDGAYEDGAYDDGAYDDGAYDDGSMNVEAMPDTATQTSEAATGSTFVETEAVQ